MEIKEKLRAVRMDVKEKLKHAEDGYKGKAEVAEDGSKGKAKVAEDEMRILKIKRRQRVRLKCLGTAEGLTLCSE